MISIHINPFNPDHGSKLPFEKYKGGYRLTKDVSIEIGPDLRDVSYNSKNIDGNPVTLLIKNGTMYASAGFWWDGASGPAIDDPTNMLSSMIHDILWGMNEYCTKQKLRKPCSYRHSNELLMVISIRQGMEPWRAMGYFTATGTGGILWRAGIDKVVNGIKGLFRK